MVFTDAPAATSANAPLNPESLGVVSAEGSVAEILRRRILSGRLGVGARLRQTDIAQELGVSTTPVREALRSLTAEGLLEIDTNRGAVIRKLSDDELVEVLELQVLIETASLRTSVPLMTEAALTQAEFLHRRMIDSVDGVEWALLNRDFHLTLAAPSGRARTQRALRELLNVSTIQLRQDIEDWEGRRSQGERDHARFIEIARAGDVEAAVELIEAHTGAAIRHRLEMRDSAAATPAL
ncbi:GntR family transcriptional regulator [Herbiconiux sp. P15]|uniref:GntR family transcriptional regulator n=1 Tax=Herbiconiux liukaitaii TaxID=3342799 RepID=UPI0035B775A8